jgi:hypothetical protein
VTTPVFNSFPSRDDWDPIADPAAAVWTGISGVSASADFFGNPIALPPTQIRSRWTRANLYLLFLCPYNRLHLNPRPVTNAETCNLWDWDVAEAFIGPGSLHPRRYKEFQVSPQGEYVDLAIDRDDPRPPEETCKWESGFNVMARIDSRSKHWCGEMRIPFASLDVEPPKGGDELRIGLFRIEGPEPADLYHLETDRITHLSCTRSVRDYRTCVTL